jgi:hypothetical protein
MILTVRVGRRIYDRVRSKLAYRVDARCANYFGELGSATVQDANWALINLVQYLLLGST